ncbi:MAG TPA: TonB-dependent receptor [Puia sp.]|jgi:TonB-linked SusC/RagA family outer membrane protein
MKKRCFFKQTDHVRALLSWFVTGVLLLFVTGISAQTTKPSAGSSQRITGKVTDARSEPLSGATVKVVGKDIATRTDADGMYSLSAAAIKGASLSFSFVGYSPKEVKMDANKTVYNISLEDAVAGLNDVVVIGYGTARKKDITGSVASISAEELTKTPIANFAQGMEGRVAGMQITQNSGAPGGNISVRIRGTNSINGSSEPLYVVDGLQMTNDGGVSDMSSLSTINPNDIESIEVLKDASATAIYGANGANGVVLITTKRGRAGPTRLTYDSYVGTQKITKKIKVMDLQQWAALQNGDGGSMNAFPNPDTLGKGTDWQDVIYRKAPTQSHNLSLSGGSAQTKVSMSANFLDQDGIIIHSNFKRYSFRTNVDHKINDRFKTGASLFSSYSQYNGITVSGTNALDATFTGVVGAALAAPPILKPYNADGSIDDFAGQFNAKYAGQPNPLYVASPLQLQTVKRTLANVYGEATIARGLTYRASFSGDEISQLNDFYSYVSDITPVQRNNNSGSAGKANTNNLLLLHESVLSYLRSFGDHSLKFTGVYATQSGQYNYNSISASGFPNDQTRNEALQLAAAVTVNTNRTSYRLDSYLARLNYGFRHKYLLDLTGRYDGSTKFGANNKYGFFPAASAAWRVIDEDFIKRLHFLSDLKIRASYGLTGNAGALQPYSSLALVSSTSVYDFNHIAVNGIGPTSVPNPDLKWESSLQTDIGLDLGLFNDRITFVMDAYDKTTNNLLYVKLLPLSSGFASIPGNFAKIDNRGLEFATNAKILTGKFQWNLSANLSINRNKVLGLDGVTNETFLNTYSLLKIGQPVGVFKTFVFNGIYQLGEPVLPGSGSTAGGTKVKDLNHDGQITADDETITGDPNPKFIYGFSSNFNFMHFDLSVFFAGSYGNKVFNNGRFALENPNGGFNNVEEELVNRWTPKNPSNEYLGIGALARNVVTDRYVEDGSFLRCKNITLGYTLPRIKGIFGARFYVSANNVFIITKYKGYDPEVNSYGNSTTQLGIDNFVYPSARTLLAGLQITL